MGHAPHPTQSLVNSCEEFYQAKQLFSLTQGNGHVLAQLQKDSPVPKCKNILRIAKKKLQGGQSSNKICSLVRGKIYAHKHVQVRLICCRFAFATARYEGLPLKPLGALAHRKTVLLRSGDNLQQLRIQFKVLTRWGLSAVSHYKQNERQYLFCFTFLWGFLPVQYP